MLHHQLEQRLGVEHDRRASPLLELDCSRLHSRCLSALGLSSSDDALHCSSSTMRQRAAVVEFLTSRLLSSLILQAQLVHRVGVAQRVLVGDDARPRRGRTAPGRRSACRGACDFVMISLISATSPLKIRSWISGEFEHDLHRRDAALAVSRGIRRCETSARRLSDRSISSCSRRSSGKKLMMRSSAWLALLACSVASTGGRSRRTGWRAPSSRGRGSRRSGSRRAPGAACSSARAASCRCRRRPRAA